MHPHLTILFHLDAINMTYLQQPIAVALLTVTFSPLMAQSSPEPAAPSTQLTSPVRLVTAETFDRAESLAAKGKPGWHGGIGEWQVMDGALHAKDEKPSASRPNGHEAVCEYVTEVRDLIFTAEFKLGAAPHVGFVCRDTKQPNHHLGRIMVTEDAVWLQKMSGIAKQTEKEVLQKINTHFDPNQWYQVTIEVIGNTWHAVVGEHELSASNACQL
jgi:hypothetical protein